MCLWCSWRPGLHAARRRLTQLQGLHSRKCCHGEPSCRGRREPSLQYIMVTAAAFAICVSRDCKVVAAEKHKLTQTLQRREAAAAMSKPGSRPGLGSFLHPSFEHCSWQSEETLGDHVYRDHEHRGRARREQQWHCARTTCPLESTMCDGLRKASLMRVWSLAGVSKKCAGPKTLKSQ